MFFIFALSFNTVFLLQDSWSIVDSFLINNTIQLFRKKTFRHNLSFKFC